MNEDELKKGLRRLTPYLREPLNDYEVEQRAVYVADCMRKFHQLSPVTWNNVMTWVVDHHETQKLPSMAELTRALEAVRTRGGVEGAGGYCGTCNGKGQVLAYYRVPTLYPDDYVTTSMVPCACTGLSPAREVRPGVPLVEATRAEYEAWRSKQKRQPPEAGRRSINGGAGGSATTTPPAPPPKVEAHDEDVPMGEEREL